MDEAVSNVAFESNLRRYTKEVLLARKGRYYAMCNSTNGLMVDGAGHATITAERLAQIWLFAAKEIPDEELRALADMCQTMHVTAGRKLFGSEDAADAMYILVQGQCEVTRVAEVDGAGGGGAVERPRIWDAGDVLGELNLLPDIPKPWVRRCKWKSVSNFPVSALETKI
jgi:CRP-like cAMP-binding protein